MVKPRGTDIEQEAEFFDLVRRCQTGEATPAERRAVNRAFRNFESLPKNDGNDLKKQIYQELTGDIKADPFKKTPREGAKKNIDGGLKVAREKSKTAPKGVGILKVRHAPVRGRGDVRGLNAREARQLDTLQAFRQQDPSDRPVSLVSQALTLCPLPFRKPLGDKVTLEARLPQGNLKVTLTNIGEAANSSLAYGDDALLLDLLSHEARWKKDPEISFDRAYEFLEFLGLESRGGKNYRTVNERLQRIRDLMIQIKRKGMAVANIRVVDIGSDETPSTQDLDREERGERRMIPYVIRLSPEYYADLLNYYLAIPTAVIQAFRGCPTEYSLAKWIVYRLDALETETEITLESLHDERGSKDSNCRRFKKKVEVTVLKLQEAWPEVGKALSITKKGLKMRKPPVPLEAGRPSLAPLPLD